MDETLAIAGSGTIACGLAATASQHGEVLLWARSGASADRATRMVARHHSKLPDCEGLSDRVRVVTQLDELAEATFLVEAVVEDAAHKAKVLTDLARASGPDVVLATTTSSLSVAELGAASGRPRRFAGLHVFNPVPRMPLVELVFCRETDEDVRARTYALCERLGKTPLEVPDTPGFVVNRLLFPYLFDAVRLIEQTGLEPEVVDQCMTLGAGVPMGPLALLDFVGLDVAGAIGEAIGAQLPERLTKLVADGALGRKSGRGFYDYD